VACSLVGRELWTGFVSQDAARAAEFRTTGGQLYGQGWRQTAQTLPGGLVILQDQAGDGQQCREPLGFPSLLRGLFPPPTVTSQGP